jgi:hypothetical protein
MHHPAQWAVIIVRWFIFKLPISAIGSGWDNLVLSVVEGFSESAFGFAARLRRLLPKNPKLQKTNDK